MHFLIDADLPRSLAASIRQRGHEATDVRDIGLRNAKDPVFACYAREHNFCLITGDYDFADIRNYPPEQYAGIVVLFLPRTATASYINQLVDQFLASEELLPQLLGQLAIVEPGRVRLRRSNP
jgi:predicted nuclease of predicted toxin-antitoxin system